MKKTSGNMKESAQQIIDESVAAEAVATEDGAVAGVAEEQPENNDRVGELERELTLEKDKYLRLAAEFDNFRKRMTRERSEAEVRGQADLVRQILDPLDDISRFADLDPAVTDSSTVVQGVDMVEKKFEKQLRAAGLEPLNPVDQPFDPNLHEAVATEPAASADMDNTVSTVYQVGYTFKGQLLRPARVVVRQHSGSH
jgi:molecular chaperone GrpE